jgi:LysM domain-containing protein
MSRKYQVQAGDTLFAISKRFYGEPTYFGLIAAANPSIDPNKISPQQTISIPDLPDHWDVVQANGTARVDKTGVLSVNVACTIPAGMRLVVESVSGRLVQAQGVLSPMVFGATDILARPENPLAFFPWVQSFYSGDIENPVDQRWFAFHSATRLYVAGPVQTLTFSAGFAGQNPDGSGFADVYICVNGYLEANPTG